MIHWEATENQLEQAGKPDLGRLSIPYRHCSLCFPSSQVQVPAKNPNSQENTNINTKQQ